MFTICRLVGTIPIPPACATNTHTHTWARVCSHLMHKLWEVVHGEGTACSAPYAYYPGQYLNNQNWHTLTERRLHLLTVHLGHQLLHTTYHVRRRSTSAWNKFTYMSFHTSVLFLIKRSYSELSGNVFRLQFNRWFLADFKIPRTEDFYGKKTFGPVNPETLSKRLGHTVKRDE